MQCSHTLALGGVPGAPGPPMFVIIRVCYHLRLVVSHASVVARLSSFPSPTSSRCVARLSRSISIKSQEDALCCAQGRRCLSAARVSHSLRPRGTYSPATPLLSIAYLEKYRIHTAVRYPSRLSPEPSKSDVLSTSSPMRAG